jgi:RNA polymerase sigma-70 factor (ECF subfamily)
MSADDRNDPLEACMEVFLQGDARGFERLYRRLAPRLRGFLRGLCGDPGLAEDLTQATFLKVHQARETYRLGAPVEPWVFAIARRTWLDHLRYRRRRPEALSADGQLPEAHPDAAAPQGFEALSSDALEKLERSLEQLPAPQREAIVLLKVDGLSVAEAADVAGITASNLKVRAHRGYEALRRALGVERSS